MHISRIFMKAFVNWKYENQALNISYLSKRNKFDLFHIFILGSIKEY